MESKIPKSINYLQKDILKSNNTSSKNYFYKYKILSVTIEIICNIPQAFQ